MSRRIRDIAATGLVGSRWGPRARCWRARPAIMHVDVRRATARAAQHSPKHRAAAVIAGKRLKINVLSQVAGTRPGHSCARSVTYGLSVATLPRLGCCIRTWRRPGACAHRPYLPLHRLLLLHPFSTNPESKRIAALRGLFTWACVGVSLPFMPRLSRRAPSRGRRHGVRLFGVRRSAIGCSPAKWTAPVAASCSSRVSSR